MAKFNDMISVFNGRPNSKQKPTDIATLLARDLEILEQQASGEFLETLVTSGFADLDHFSGGFRDGNLIVLAGRPAMGKTSLALDIALNVSKKGIGTAIFSFEMTSQEILRRMMSKMAKINVLKLRHGDIPDSQMDHYKQASQALKQYPLDLVETNMTRDQIEYHIQALNSRLHPKETRLAIIDHLQIMGTKDRTKYERRDRQLATYTSQLKDLAKRNDCAVLLLSQLNRMSEHRSGDDKAPRLADLRESGAIEQDTDIVLGIHRPIVDDGSADPHLAKLKILKNRSGPTGIIDLRWTPEFASFSDQPRSEDDGKDYADVPF